MGIRVLFLFVSWRLHDEEDMTLSINEFRTGDNSYWRSLSLVRVSTRRLVL